MGAGASVEPSNAHNSSGHSSGGRGRGRGKGRRHDKPGRGHGHTPAAAHAQHHLSHDAQGDTDISQFPRLGVKLSYWKAFLDACGADALQGLTSTDVCEQFIKPATEATRCSYCELLQTHRSDAVGVATVFISHAWKYAFLDVLDALRSHFVTQPDVIIWFDLFSNNQHETAIHGFDWWSNTFKSAIATFGHTVMVFAPWDNPIPLTRAWCLWELYCTIETKSLFEVALSPSQRQRFLTDIASDGAARSINRMFATITCEKSECFSEQDKEHIFHAVQATVGFAGVNAMIFKRLREWVTDVTKAELEKETNAHRREALMSNLAGIYDSLGKYDKAEALLVECLALRRGSHGENHPSTLQSMNNLAGLFNRQGRYDQSENMYVDCLTRMRAHLGNDDPDTLTCMSNLAAVYDSQGKYEQAEGIYQECLAKCRVILGDKHPDTLAAMNNLAAVLDSLGKLDQAEAMYAQCLPLLRSELGDNHPNTLSTINNLASIYDAQGKLIQAEPFYEECLIKTRTALGQDHPNTLGSMNNLAALYFKQNKLPQALELYQDCLDKMQRVLGDAHPDVLTVLNSLAVLHCKLKQFDEAGRLYEECLCKMKTALGEDHPDTVELMCNIKEFNKSRAAAVR